MRNHLYNTLNLFYPVFNNLYKNRLRVLAYHDIADASNFESQIKWLKSKYNIIDIDTLKDHFFKNRKLPQNSLLITLDDGDKTVYTNGLPVFKKHKVPAVLFIITELIDTNKDFWWNTIIKNERKNGLAQPEIMKVINKNKSLSNEQRIKYLEQYPTTHQEQLTVEEVRELNKNKVYIGNHSHTHPMFDKLKKEELLNELEQVRKKFNNYNTGDYAVFAYPNGNFNKETENLLKENNINIAFFFDHKINKEKINPLRVSRIAVDSDTPLPEFKIKVSGLHPFILNFKK